jgi:hypothetical protein
MTIGLTNSGRMEFRHGPQGDWPSFGRDQVEEARAWLVKNPQSIFMRSSDLDFPEEKVPDLTREEVNKWLDEVLYIPPNWNLARRAFLAECQKILGHKTPPHKIWVLWARLWLTTQDGYNPDQEPIPKI